METIQQVNSHYEEAIIEYDLSSFNENEQKALFNLREASKIMDELFCLQSTGTSYAQWISLINNKYRNNNN